MNNVVELFAGIGISAIGIPAAGRSLVRAVEINAKFVTAFNSQKILPSVAVQGSVGVVDLPVMDVLAGGPVCKAFSPGATLFGTDGKADSRNTFPLFMAEVEKYLPEYVLMENSSGLARFSGYVNELKTAFKHLGYHVRFFEVDCFDYGVPQHRRRVLFLCRRRCKWGGYPPSRRLDGPATVGDCLGDPPMHDPWPLLLEMTPASLDYYLRDPRHAKKHPPLVPHRPASTVVSVYRKGVPYGVVSVRPDAFHLCGPRLAARLQGVPDEYDLSMLSKTGALEAIGNGFPPQVMSWWLGCL